MSADAIAGAILGCAVGDVLGLPYEGLSRSRGTRLLGEPSRFRFLFGHGMVSDDTENTCFVAESLCEHPDDPDGFSRVLARRLRWWLLGLPAGIGLATLRSILRMWVGFPPTRSGVFSAGNGPAMRSAILGAAIDDQNLLYRFVRASTILTHTEPKALEGALAVALVVWCAKRKLTTPSDYFEQLRGMRDWKLSDEFATLLSRLERSVPANQSTTAFADEIGCSQGISGYVFHTAPVVLHVWLRHPLDVRAALDEIIRCGGDTDTTAAMVGAIVATGVGPAGIPPNWLGGLWEWPRSVGFMERLACATSEAVRQKQPVRPPAVPPFIELLRNAIFLITVLFHGFRRLLPPY